MSVELEPEQVRHRVGTCPACRGYIWADVTLVTSVSPAALKEDGTTSVYAVASAIAASLSHECDSRGEGDDG